MNIYKKISIICCFVVAIIQTSSAQSSRLSRLIQFQDKIQGIDPTNLSEHKDTVTKFLAVFKEVRNYELGNRDLKGTVNFGFNGNQSSSSKLFNNNNNSIYNIIGGLSLSRGTYPSQLEISTQLNVSLVNGKLTENLSNINISYDRHFSDQAGLALESYSFLNRRTDIFLGVTQRYEIGGGVIIASWSRKIHDLKVAEKIENLENKFSNIKVESGVLTSCLNDCIKLGENIKEADVELIVKSQEKIQNSIIKQNSPMRIGMLVGLFVETEKTMFSDSLLVDNSKVFRTVDFDPTVRLRWEIRPTLDFRIMRNAVSVKIRPYFKFPMPWDWTKTIGNKDVFDFRMDFPMIVNIKVNEEFSINLSHTIFYDHTPSSTAVDGLSMMNGDPVFATLNRIHQFSLFQVAFKI